MIIFSTIAVIVSVVIGTNILQSKIYTVSIYDSGNVTEIRTIDLSVKKALDAAKIKIGEFDEINVDINGTLSRNDPNIYISRAKKVSLTIGDGEPRVFYTQDKSVGDVLNDNNINLSTHDYLNTVPEFLLNNNITNIIYKQAIPVKITIDGFSIIVYTNKSTVKEVLAENNIYVNDEDLVNQKLTGTIDINNKEILIQMAHSLTLRYDGIVKNVATQAKTVGELLAQNGVKLSSLDKLANGVTVNTPLRDGLVISVIRVIEKQMTETVVIPYQTRTEKVATIAKGTTRVATKGVNGIRADTYTVVTENGKQVSKTLVSSVITKQPVDAVTQVGTKTQGSTGTNIGTGTTNLTTFSSSYKVPAEGQYTKVLSVKAVAYNLGEMTNRKPGDPGYGHTANGMMVRPGIIAVDKKVIPLGTKVYVEIDNGPDYGYAIAADVGVSGYCIDLYLNSPSECINFGRRSAKVYILANQKLDVFSMR